RDKDRLPTHVGRVVVVLLGNLAFVSKVDPVALENVFHLQLEQPLVREHLALAAEDAFFFVVFNKRIQVIDSQGHGRGLHCFCFNVMKAIARRDGPISVSCSTSIRFLQCDMESHDQAWPWAVLSGTREREKLLPAPGSSLREISDG